MNRKDLLEQIKNIKIELDSVLKKNGTYEYKNIIMQDLLHSFFSNTKRFNEEYNNIVNNTNYDIEYFLSPRLLEYYKMAMNGVLVNVKSYDLFSSYDKEALNYIGKDQGAYQKEAYRKKYNSSTVNDFRKYNDKSRSVGIILDEKKKLEDLNEEKQKELFGQMIQALESNIKSLNGDKEDILSLIDEDLSLASKITFISLSNRYIKVFNNYKSYLNKINEMMDIIKAKDKKKEKRKVKNIKPLDGTTIRESGQVGFEGFEENGTNRKR